MANNFPFGRHFPIAVWVMPLRSEPPDSLNSLQLLWDGTSCCTHGCSQQYWSVPAGKVRVVTEVVTSLSQNPTQTWPWLPAQLLPVSHPLSPPEPGPQYDQGQEVFPEDNAQHVLLEGTVLWCFCRDLLVAAAAKLTEAAQPALELTRGFREGKEICLCHLSPPAPSSCTLQSNRTCQPSQHLQTLPMTLFLTPSLISSFYCLLPPISNTTDCPCQQLQPFTTVCSVSRKNQKPDQRSLLQISCGKISFPYTQYIPNTKEKAFQALIFVLSCLEKKEASGICGSIIFHIKSEARLS